MSLRTFYNRFVEALGHTFPNPIHITWDDNNYIVSSSPLSYSSAVVPKIRKEEELRTDLKQQGVPQEVIDKIIEIVPQKKSITLYQKSYISVLPSPKDYCLIGDWVILYHL